MLIPIAIGISMTMEKKRAKNKSDNYIYTLAKLFKIK